MAEKLSLDIPLLHYWEVVTEVKDALKKCNSDRRMAAENIAWCMVMLCAWKHGLSLQHLIKKKLQKVQNPSKKTTKDGAEKYLAFVRNGQRGLLYS